MRRKTITRKKMTNDIMDCPWQTIEGNIPSKSNSYRIVTVAGHASLTKTAALKKYEDSFYMQVGKYRNMGISGLFEFYIRVYYPSMRSDLDNSLKCVLDCLQRTGTIKNDNKCVRIEAEKYIDKARPRIEFCIRTVNELKENYGER